MDHKLRRGLLPLVAGHRGGSRRAGAGEERAGDARTRRGAAEEGAGFEGRRSKASASNNHQQPMYPYQQPALNLLSIFA